MAKWGRGEVAEQVPTALEEAGAERPADVADLLVLPEEAVGRASRLHARPLW